MEFLTVRTYGLKCDNKSCNYEDTKILFKEYLNFIDKPCPKCGESLLTKQSYDDLISKINLAAEFKKKNEIIIEIETEKLLEAKDLIKIIKSQSAIMKHHDKNLNGKQQYKIKISSLILENYEFRYYKYLVGFIWG